jgi:hypothetical protein
MSRFHWRRVAAVTAIGASLACAGASAGSTAGQAGAAASPARHDRTLITADEMSDLQASNLYDVVKRLHPEWLTLRNSATVGGAVSGRTATNENDVQVFLDTQHAGSSDMLRQMAVTSATSLKFYSASEAQARFGNGNLNGVIQVVSATKR